MNISIEKVKKSFKKQLVLNNIELDIMAGNIYCLLGSSGSGKTTLLRIVMGAIQPDSGRVTVDDMLVPDKKILSMIGYMPQQNALYDELSIWDNLRFFAGIQKMKKKEFDKAAKEVLAVVGLEKESKKLVGKCSGGMKKRASLAAAMIHNPPILILDEPTVGIDPVLRQQIWGYLKKLRALGTTIIVTTHVMDEVSECDGAALLRGGRIIQADTVENLLKMTSKGKIEELFLLDGEGEESLC